jgi:type I restriction enzyme S subunit
MNAQDLKNSILQLAIQGKLVEHRKEGGTAKELLEQIKAEKERLVNEKNIKKEKPLPAITEDEIPFDIPESWAWVRLRNVVYNRGQITPNERFSYIDIGSINNKKQILNENESIIEPYDAPSRARKIVDCGDILYSTVRPYLHNMCIIDREFSCQPIASTGFAVMTCCEGIYNKFLFNYLQSPTFDAYANSNENSKGVAYPAINDDRLYRAIVPIPPFEEQKRIVAKIEELMPFIDKYGESHLKLEALNKKFPEDMQKSILQYAIQGKLFEQRVKEGTAEELYQQIQEEKARLIKQGKIKKDKPLPEITENEIPFEIPESWKWVRLGEIGSWSAGATPSRVNPEYYVGDIPWLKTGDLNDSYIDAATEFISDKALEKASVRLNPIGSVLMAMYGATIGKLGILNIEATTNQACCACITYKGMLNIYLFYYLMGQRKNFIKMGAGGAQPNISKEKIVMSIIPLPPLQEQMRIVDKIEEIFPCCAKLKNSSISKNLTCFI